MKLRALLLFSVIVLIPVEQANCREPALPDKLMRANTLCLDVNRAVLGFPLRGEGNLKVGENASEALKKWGRLTVVPNCGSADAVLSVIIEDLDGGKGVPAAGYAPTRPSGVGAAPATVRRLEFTIIDQRSRQTLYSDHIPDCSRLSSCIKSEIKTLRKRMEKQGN